MTYRQRRQVPGKMSWVPRDQLTDLAPEGLVTVHDAFGITRGARGECHNRRTGGIGVKGTRKRFVSEQFLEVLSNQANHRHSCAQVWMVLHSTELLSSNEHLRFSG
jgi:hypothetical protein